MEKKTLDTLASLSLKQKAHLYFYRFGQLLHKLWHRIKEIGASFFDSVYFYILAFFAILIFINIGLNIFSITPTSEELRSLGFGIAGIIGASIAIIFSFSTFILQSTADLFSTQYLRKFIQDKREKYFFWALVILTVISFLVPIFTQKFAIEILFMVFFLAFLLIYSLYKNLRKRINPETTLDIIKRDAISHLEKSHKALKKQTDIQGHLTKFKDEEKRYLLPNQYKLNPNWGIVSLENVKYLYEIGLRLIAKNEINSFNISVKYIFDIYLKHLSIRNGHIVRRPANFWGAYTFEDEGFTTEVLEYLESIGNRIIQDKRKENIYFLLNLYENLIASLTAFKYTNDNLAARGENPILSLVLAYYFGLIRNLVEAEEADWVWESIKSISKVSDTLLSTDNNHYHHNQINQSLDEITIRCLSNKGQEAFIKQIVGIYFNQIRIGWDKYSYDDIYWQDIFKSLRKGTLALAVHSELNLSTSDLYIGYNSWLISLINSIFEVSEKDKQTEFTELYVNLLERWSEFLLDLARDFGLENSKIGLQIVQSLENNLKIIKAVEGNVDLDLRELYRTQFHIISWYFKKTEKVESSSLHKLEQIQGLLLNEIHGSILEGEDSAYIEELYLSLVQQHFEKVSEGYGFNHPRVVVKLVHLGLILTLHNLDTSKIIQLINELNKKYLELYKDYFEKKHDNPSLMGPNEHQLCKEIHELENDLFSHGSSMTMDEKQLLRQKITKEIWENFIGKIEYCKGIKYKTNRGL